MPHIPPTPPRPVRLSETSLDLTQADYHWLVDRRMAALRIRPPEERGEHYDSALERVVEEANFLPVSFLSVGTQRARAVCRIEMSDQRRRWRPWGTGFLVAPAVVMTNNHVLESAAWAKAARLLFGDELDDEGNPRQPEIVRLAPGKLFVTDSDLDFTVCAVEGRPGDRWGYLKLSRDPHIISRHEHVNIVQHPSGRKKEICVQENRVEYLKTRVMLYTTDTEPGSSGSPVFDNGWNVVALHHSGGEQQNGVWLSNEGIRISSIVRYLEETAAAGRTEEARVVLEHAQGVNPYDGIFGAHGRRPLVPEDWPATEKVVYSYQGNDAFLDVGFWNLEHFNAGVSTERRTRIADLLEHLALDVLGLVEVEEPAVKALVDDLNGRGFTLAYLVENAPGAQDMAVIYDTSTVSAARLEWSPAAKANLSAKVAGTGKQAWYRIPLLARLTTTPERSAHGEPFDFLLCVLHAKATTHFDTPGIPEQVRAEAARRLADELGKMMDSLPEDDLIAGGDFNARLEEPSFGALSDRLQATALTAGDARSGDPDAYTYLGSQRGLIDHIYVTPGANTNFQADSISITRIDRDIPDFRDQVSDHAPVIARFTFHERGGAPPPEPPPPDDTFEVTVPAGTKKVVIKVG